MDTLHLRRRYVLPMLFVVVHGAIEAESVRGQRFTGIQARPAHEIVWLGRGGGFQRLGTSGAGSLVGLSVKPWVMDVWSWTDDGSLKMSWSGPMQSPDTFLWLGDGRLLADPLGSPKNTIVLRDAKTSETVRQWPLSRPGYVLVIGMSRNGEYVALGEEPDLRLDEYRHPPFPIAMLGPKRDELVRVATLIGDGSGVIKQIVPSDDGAYIAVAGWLNGVAVVDVRQKRLAWEGKPWNEASTKDAQFSPDAKVLYIGGTEGCVYGMDVATGNIVSRWFATLSGETEYGHRITTVSVSADGRFVAAGTGPEGLVWVWERATGKRLMILNHGRGTILITQFSPDSKALATFSGGLIKVWDMPPGPATAPATQPATAPATRPTTQPSGASPTTRPAS